MQFAGIAQSIGSSLDLQKSEMLDGTTKWIGNNSALGETVVLQGPENDLRYAHLALILSSGAEDDVNAKDTRVEQFAFLFQFAKAVDPMWDSKGWIDANFSRAYGGESPTITQDGLTFTLEFRQAERLLLLVVQRQ